MSVMTDLTKNGFKAATCDEQQIEALAYPRAVEPYFRLYRSACGRPATKRKRESQQLCKRRKCKSQFVVLKAGFLLGHYHPSSHALDASKNATKSGTLSRPKADRPWRHPIAARRTSTAGPAKRTAADARGGEDERSKDPRARI